MASPQFRPDWWGRAQRAALSLRATTLGATRATHSVYVGQTSRDPDLRFDQHKAGYKASSAARRFGVRLLPELVQHLNPMRRWEAAELEAALAEAFVAAGVPWVEGGH